jgi:hypothetical protein
MDIGPITIFKSQLHMYTKNERNLTCRLNLLELDNGNDYESFVSRMIEANSKAQQQQNRYTQSWEDLARRPYPTTTPRRMVIVTNEQRTYGSSSPPSTRRVNFFSSLCIHFLILVSLVCQFLITQS